MGKIIHILLNQRFEIIYILLNLWVEIIHILLKESQILRVFDCPD